MELFAPVLVINAQGIDLLLVLGDGLQQTGVNGLTVEELGDDLLNI